MALPRAKYHWIRFIRSFDLEMYLVEVSSTRACNTRGKSRGSQRSFLMLQVLARPWRWRRGPRWPSPLNVSSTHSTSARPDVKLAPTASVARVVAASDESSIGIRMPVRREFRKASSSPRWPLSTARKLLAACPLPPL